MFWEGMYMGSAECKFLIYKEEDCGRVEYFNTFFQDCSKLMNAELSPQIDALEHCSSFCKTTAVNKF